jgi:hypothetical protein
MSDIYMKNKYQQMKYFFQKFRDDLSLEVFLTKHKRVQQSKLLTSKKLKSTKLF